MIVISIAIMVMSTAVVKSYTETWSSFGQISSINPASIFRKSCKRGMGTQGSIVFGTIEATFSKRISMKMWLSTTFSYMFKALTGSTFSLMFNTDDIISR